jgi:NAD(P)-dependent dehydrogenase (short-subunit alcohol dehydrogenase family)
VSGTSHGGRASTHRGEARRQAGERSSPDLGDSPCAGDDRQALKRRLTPDDIAAAVAYLASDMAAAMTGQVLCADGGLIMR